MKTTLLVSVVAGIVGVAAGLGFCSIVDAATPVLPGKPKGFIPVVILYDEAGEVHGIRGFKMEETLQDCFDQASHIGADLIKSGIAARVTCLPVGPAPESAIEGVGPRVST